MTRVPWLRIFREFPNLHNYMIFRSPWILCAVKPSVKIMVKKNTYLLLISAEESITWWVFLIVFFGKKAIANVFSQCEKPLHIVYLPVSNTSATLLPWLKLPQANRI